MQQTSPMGIFHMWGSRRLLRGALSAVTALFGGLGIFFLYQGLADDPAQLPRALIFLGSASSIVWSSSQLSNKGPNRRQ